MIDISKLYTKIKESELDFFQTGGPFDPATNISAPSEDDFLGEGIPIPLPTERDIAYAMSQPGNNNYTGSSNISIPRLNLSAIPSEYDFTGAQRDEIPEAAPTTYDSLADELKAKLGIVVPTANGNIPAPAPVTGHDDKNYDTLSFAEAWKQARSKVGPEGTFTYKGKRFNTLAADKSKSSTPSGSGKRAPGASGGLSGEEVDYNKLVKLVQTSPNLTNLKGYSKQLLNAILENNVGSGEAQQLVKQALNGSGTQAKSTSNSRMSDIEKQKALINYGKKELDIINQKNLIAALKKPKTNFNFFHGPLTPEEKKAREIQAQKDKIESLKNPQPFFRGPNIQSREMGGEIEEFAYGGQPLPVPNFGALSSLVDPVTGQVINPNPGITNINMNAQPQQSFGSMYSGVQLTPQNQTPQFRFGENIDGSSATGFYNPNDLNNNVGFSQDGRTVDATTGAKFGIPNWAAQSTDAQRPRTPQDEEEAFRRQMALLGQMQNTQQYDVSEDLRMVGQSLAFNAKDNAKYTNDTDRGIATGLNITRGVSAGLDALVGGSRELYGGFATQKRQQNIENEFYKRQRRNLENQQNRFEDGGRVDDLLAMFAQGGQNPNDFAAAFGEQDKRQHLSPEELLTGEFIQQAPPQAGVQPNAELEKDEFVKHPDGDVQQVIGRTHNQGGERLALEPGAVVVSDKVKLGAKNAKVINNQYDLGIKAGDTFAHVVEKYTKKVGLSKLNDEQESYFNQLKKVSENEDVQTSEINNSFLSQKINDLEKQKEVVEASRSEFTDFIYQLQEGSKPQREEDAQAVMAEGGRIGDPPLTEEQIAAMNAAFDSNGLDPRLGGNLWEGYYYQPMNKWQQYLGMTPTDRKTHLDYQKDVTGLLNPQIQKLVQTGEMPLTNKHRALLEKAGVKDAKNKTAYTQLTDEDKKKLGTPADFINQGYEDGLPGHRGVTVLPGDATEEEYQKMTGAYDKLTDDQGRKIYAQYNDDGTIKKDKDGKVRFYYPKTGEKVPEAQAKEAAQTIQAPNIPKKAPYQAPYLPSQRPVAPSPASPVPVYQTRLDRLTPVNLGYDQQVAEINRQSDAASSQFDGLTDTQRASALTNLSANVQQNVAGVVSNTAVQNAMNQFQTSQINLQQSNAEEQARLSNARYSDEMWMRTEANQEADNRDYQEALQRVQLGRFRYLQKDRQIHDMMENFRVGADGGIEFDQASAVPLSLTPTGDTVMQDQYGRTKVVKTTKTDSKGNVISSTTQSTKKP